MQTQNHQIQKRAQTQNILSAVRANLESALNRRLHLIRGLTAFVIAKPNFTKEEFEAFVQELNAHQNGIRSLQLAPNAVVTYIYPEKGNEAAKGHDLLNDPKRRKAVLHAIEKKKFIIAGPVELKQGGQALIGRVPIFLTSRNELGLTKKFWGLAIILVDLEPLFEEAHLHDINPQLEIALRGENGLGPQGAPFFGNPDIFQNSDSVILNVSLPNGSWQIAANVRQNWRTSWAGRGLFYTLGIFSVLISGWLVFQLVRKPAQLQETIDQGATQLRTLFTAIRSVATGIVITDRNGVIEWINPAFSQETGYAPNDIIGKTHVLLNSGLQPKTFYQDLWQTILAGKSWRGEFTNRHKNGRLYVDESIITPVLDQYNQVERFIAVKQDITKRRQEETALQASNLRFHSLIQSARDAIIIANQDGHIEIWNRGASEIFGYKEEEVIHRAMDFLMPEQYRNRHNQGIRRLLEHNKKPDQLHSFTKELTGLRKDQTEFPLELSLSHWKMGNQWFHLAIIRDLTSRKTIEQELKNYAEKLEVMVEERTRQLLHTERLATLGTFSAGIAHEIKNPNSFISGNVAFLQQFWSLAAPILQQATEDKPDFNKVARFLQEVAPALEGINKGSDRIRTIIESLKSYATGNRGTEKKPILLSAPLQEAQTLLQHRFKQGTQLLLTVPDDLKLLCNAQEISQIFINLFNNAMDAMDEATKQSNRTIWVEACRLEKEIQILIKDNGPGIPKQAHETIFDPFFTTKDPTRGTGLGLSIVKGIIENHHGRITLLTHEPPGATFEIVFPLMQTQDVT